MRYFGDETCSMSKSLRSSLGQFVYFFWVLPWLHCPQRGQGGTEVTPQVLRSSPNPAQGCPVPGWVPLAPGAGAGGWCFPLRICIFPAFIFLPVSVLLQLQTL